MKKILILALALAVVLTACNPNGGVTLPEGTPDTKGTIEEFKAWINGNAGETVPDSEIATTVVTALQGCISNEKPDMMDNPEYAGKTVVFEGKEVDISGIICAYYGNATLNTTGTRIDLGGRIMMGEFILDISGYFSMDAVDLNVGGQNFKVTYPEVDTEA